MLKANNFRDMSIDELEANFGDISKELFDLINEKKRAKKMEKPHLLRLKRKEKARLLTVLHEKRSENQKSEG